jgi:predicted XRE-type DNA-binding protein
MSAGFRQKLIDVAAEQLGLKTDPVKERRQIEQSQFKQRQAEQALALAKVARQAAYVGAGLTAFSTLALTVYLLRRTIQSRDGEG